MPLVIVLGNPLGAFVPLDSQHMIAVMFGNPKWSTPIDTAAGTPAGEGEFIVEDYGAFASLVSDKQGRRFVRRHPHITAVAVLNERTNAQDFIEKIIERHRAADTSLEAAAEAAAAALDEVNRARAARRVPDGAYQWLDLYDLGSDEATPLPDGFFAGSRDVRYGFLEGNTFGRLDDGESDSPGPIAS